MRIRTLLIACIAGAGCLTIAAASYQAITAAAERETLVKVSATMTSLESLLVLSERLSLERAVIFTAFIGQVEAPPDSVDELAASADRTDESWVAVGELAMSASLAQTHIALVHARAEVLATLALPAGRRSAALLRKFFQAVRDAQLETGRAADAAEGEAGRLNIELGRLAGLARLSQNLREAAGMRSSQISLAFAGIKGLPERFDIIEQLGGRGAVLWERIRLAVSQLPAMPALAAAEQQTDRTLLTVGESIYSRMNRALREGEATPMSFAEFRTWTMPMLANALLVRDAALSEGRIKSAALGEAATLRRNVAFGVCVVTLLVAFTAILLVLWRVARPLTSLTSAMVRLAEGDVSAEIPCVHRNDELGAMARAVSVFKTSEDKISWLALHDVLTRLPNRTQLQRRMEEALRTETPTALLFLDLDHFKEVNDTLGHAAGDLLLQEVAVRLLKLLGPGGLVSRMGGDEFAILLTGASSSAQAGKIANGIIEAITRPFQVRDCPITVGISVGIAIPHGTMDAEELARNADQALYEAKADGRGVFRFHEAEMDRRLQRRRELEVDLRQAVGTDALAVHYQPIVDVTSNRIVSLEALLRWKHPVHGWISPGEFIPIAEQTGLIRTLGAHVLRTGCAVAAEWPDDVRLAVNLSPIQFQTGDLPNIVEQALVVTGFPGSRLDLEITEHVELLRNDTTLAQLRELRNMGASVCLDDFGIGYSSLSYLQAFPFEAIKIDQSFVRDLPRRESARAIVRAIAGLGTSLGMSTTAEGVETREQLDAVRAFGCTRAQGYLFSQARPPEQLWAVFSAQGAPSTWLPTGLRDAAEIGRRVG